MIKAADSTARKITANMVAVTFLIGSTAIALADGMPAGKGSVFQNSSSVRQPSPTPSASKAEAAGSIRLPHSVTGAEFSIMELSNPPRLVIDVLQVPIRTRPAPVAVGKYGIKEIRMGVYPNKVRYVLIASGDHLPAYHIDSDNGITVHMGVKVTGPKKEHAPKAGGSVRQRVKSGAPAGSDTAPATQKTAAKEKRVSLEFTDADIRKIFQLLADVSNMNFLLSDEVSGSITIKLNNVPWEQALDVILDTKNLGMRKIGNIVQIKPKEKLRSQVDEVQAAARSQENALELQTAIFTVNFAGLGDTVGQFGNLKSDRGKISSDLRTNKIIVNDTAPRIEKMRDLLKHLDTPEKQVVIEARIVEASTSLNEDMGAQWGLHFNSQGGGISSINSGLGGTVSAKAPGAGTLGPGSALGITFGKLASSFNVDLALAAAVSKGKVKIISTPSVMTVNNKAAKISQGQSIPYQTVSDKGTQTQFVSAALVLDVTPHIAPDGTISMKITASNNSPGASPSGGGPPPINMKEATTEVLLQSGETTVIGGIYADSDTVSDDGVPVLMDIPYVGGLFRSKSSTKTKSQLMIFVTPRIVN